MNVALFFVGQREEECGYSQNKVYNDHAITCSKLKRRKSLGHDEVLAYYQVEYLFFPCLQVSACQG